VNVTNVGAGEPVLVMGTGCITPGGSPNTVQLILRGPNSSTPVTQFVPNTASVEAGGTFQGLIATPLNAPVGSTYLLSAQCTEQGQPPGPESAGVPLTVTRMLSIPTITGIPVTAGGGLTGTGTGLSGPTTGVTGGTGTTGAALPIPARPNFTG